jgi:hypothetical protein
MRSRADMIGLALGVLLLALGPLVLTLLRSEDYTSTTTISMSDNPSGDLLPRPLGFVAGPVEVRDLQRAVDRRVGWLDSPRDLPDYVSIEAVDGPGRPQYVLTARGPGADEARALATASAREVIESAENGAHFFLGGELPKIERALRRDDLPAARRLELTQRRDDIQAVLDNQEFVYERTATPATRPDERAADRLLGALPGSRPLRPDPLWAGLAGLALALALLAWVLALSPASRRRAPSAQA